MPTFAIADLRRPDAYPHPVRGPELVETHISWVLLTGQWAYKIKKPVRLEFLDASSLARRQELCQEELRLNRRLAPELYVAVVPIGWRDGRWQVGATDRIVEYAVQMRQFDRSLELAELLAAGSLHPGELLVLAEQLADFHAGLAPALQDSPFGSFELVSETVLANIRELLQRAPAGELRESLEALAAWTCTALAGNREEIETRHRGGAVRECHGDLHAHNIVRWEGRLVPFDCLEFEPKLRWIDITSELAFLYMDLLSYARGDLASIMLNRYLECGGDYRGLRLLRFYVVHRALVRAKVDLLQRRHARFEQRLRSAQAQLRERQPFLLLTCGPSGSGKSWVSEALVGALGAIRVRSDLERRRPGVTDPQQRYVPASTAQTYARLLECADSSLSGGQNTIVDAAFLDRGERERFHALARQHRAPLLVVACDAQERTLRARIEQRAAAGADPSEATVAVLEQQLRSRHPLSPRELEAAIAIDTTTLETPQPAVAAIRAALAQARIP